MQQHKPSDYNEPQRGASEVRRPDTGTWLWIDAFCINQSDTDERCRQVRVMRDIYENSDSTIVWLVDATDDSGVALDFVVTLDKPSKHMEGFPSATYVLMVLTFQILGGML